MKNRGEKLRILLTTSITALFLSAFLLPANASAALTLPTTGCEPQQDNFFIYGVNQHLSSTSAREDGTKAFTYGADNNSFVSSSGSNILFDIKLLFAPDNPFAIIKLVAFDNNCNAVFGFGPSFSNLNPLADNIVSFDKDTYSVSLNGQTLISYPSGIIRYIWAEVWDGQRASNFASYSYLVDINNLQNPTGSPQSEPSGPRPVVIIPGIVGTELYDGNDLVWLNLGKMFADIGDQFLTDSLSLDNQGNSIKNITLGDVILKKLKPPFEINIFDQLVVDLKNIGYNNDQSYFLFPYDWRLDLDSTASLLKDKIEAIKTQTGFKKVNIIAHSMGGLLAKDYINQFGKDSINKLIFVGTPHLGAPKAGEVLIEGDDLGIPWLAQERLKEIGINSPAVYELLPQTKYFDNFTGYLEPRDNYNSLNYLDTKNQLLDLGANGYLFNKAEQFFGKNLQDADFSGIGAYNIAGCRTGTTVYYKMSPDNSFAIPEAYASGDGTVPLPSADYINIDAGNKFYVKNANHGTMPSMDNVRTLILGILNGNINATGSVSNSNGFCKFKGKKLSWYSPVAVHIYDQSGNHAGPTANGLENNLPGVDYQIIHGEKFIFIPSDDGNTYTIQGTGEDTGTFDLIISDIDNGTVTTSVVYNDVSITGASRVTVDAASSAVQFDLSGSGSFTTLASSATVSGNAVNDRTPPVTSANQAGSVTGPVQVTLTATDDNSGVLYTNYSFDGHVFLPYDNSINLSQPTTYKIYYYSVDKAGNDEAVKNLEVKIVYLGGGNSSVPSESNSTPNTSAEKPNDQTGQVLGKTIENPNPKPNNLLLVKDSSLVLDSADNRTVYMIGDNGKKFGFTSEEIFRKLGFNFDHLISADLSGYLLGGLIESADAPHPPGSLVINNGIIWYISSGARSAIPSMEIFNSLGFSLDQVVPANDFDLKLNEN